jgi:hypothetical protein
MSLFFLEEPSAEIVWRRTFSSAISSRFCRAFFRFVFCDAAASAIAGQRNPAISVFYGQFDIVVLMLPLLAQNPPAPTGNDILAILFLGIFQIGVAYILFTKGMRAAFARSTRASSVSSNRCSIRSGFLFSPRKAVKLGDSRRRDYPDNVAAHTIFNNRSRFKREKLS